MDLLRKRLEEMDQFEAGSKEKSVKLRSEGEEARAKEAKLRVELNGLRKIEDSMGNEMNDLRAKKEAAFRERPSWSPTGTRSRPRPRPRRTSSSGCKTKPPAADGAPQGAGGRDRSRSRCRSHTRCRTMDEIKDEITRCEATLANMGNVNLRSIEDYEEKNARHVELRNEIKRLDDQTPRPHQAHERAEREEEGRPAQGVRRGQRELPAPSTPSYRGRRGRAAAGEPGVAVRGRSDHEVQAQARQGAAAGGAKRRREVAGGAGFIFAMQEWQPSPFYLLDEVDMFLDAVNADMVAQRVKKSSQTAQFVMISLRKVTLNKADHIIGVTKPEGGISNVIMKPEHGRHQGPPGRAQGAGGEGGWGIMETNARGHLRPFAVPHAPSSTRGTAARRSNATWNCSSRPRRGRAWSRSTQWTGRCSWCSSWSSPTTSTLGT